MKNLRATPTKTDNFQGRFFHLKSCAGTFRGAGLFMAALIFVAVMVVGLFYVRTRMALVEIGYEVSSLENKNRDLPILCSSSVEACVREGNGASATPFSRPKTALPPSSQVVPIPI